jgi:hypothetical protein
VGADLHGADPHHGVEEVAGRHDGGTPLGSGELGGDPVGQLGGDTEPDAQGVGVDRGPGPGVVVVGDLPSVRDESGRNRWSGRRRRRL